MLIIRIFTNLFTIIVLTLAGAAIFYAAQYGLDNVSAVINRAKPVLQQRVIVALPLPHSALGHPVSGGSGAASGVHSVQHLPALSVLLPGSV